MSELEEYFRKIHPEFSDDIYKIVDIDTYKLWIKMKNDIDYTYDVDIDKFREPTYDEVMIVRLKEKHLTYQMLSRRAGVSKNLISDYINRRIKPDIENISKIAKGLSCSIEDLHFKE